MDEFERFSKECQWWWVLYEITSWAGVKDDNFWLVCLDRWWCHTLERQHWRVTRFGGKIMSSV